MLCQEAVSPSNSARSTPCSCHADDAQEAINNSLPIPLVDPDEYAAFFIVGDAPLLVKAGVSCQRPLSLQLQS